MNAPTITNPSKTSDTDAKLNIIHAFENQSLSNPKLIKRINLSLTQNGWILLRGFDTSMKSFSELMDSLCSRLTFDPAREYSSNATQKVNAGTDAVGLHIENGNTPFPPDVVAFYSKKSASHGSQTTICDGHQVFNQISPELRTLFSQPMLVTRSLPEQVWKQYLVNEIETVETLDQVTEELLTMMLSKNKSTSQSYLDEKKVLHSCLEVSPIIESRYSSLKSFANSILGPSFNYETPVFTYANGEVISQTIRLELEKLCEGFTHEIQWQDSDIVVVDNTRVMHGRREITVDLETRELYIGMGMK